jgi:endonuclease/exonuclease/phosphatase (EEP) superfamily protein YafD
MPSLEILWYSLLSCSLVVLLVFLLNYLNHQLTLVELVISFKPYLLAAGLVSSLFVGFIGLVETWVLNQSINTVFWLEKVEFVGFSWQVVKQSLPPTFVTSIGPIKFSLMGVSLALLPLYWLDLRQFWTICTRKPYATTTNNATNLKVAVFNVLGSNQNYADIKQNVLAAEADVVGLVELVPELAQNLDLSEKYPYQLLFPSAEDYLGLGVYSKFPLKLLYLEPKKNIFLVCSLNFNGKEVIVVLAHPEPPLGIQLNRRVLQQLADLKAKLAEYRKRTVILMGDFNLTPWSKRYQWFTENLPLYNVAFGRGWQTTWQNLLWIDHIFVSRDLLVGDYQRLARAGSDHHLISVNLKFN